MWWLCAFREFGFQHINLIDISLCLLYFSCLNIKVQKRKTANHIYLLIFSDCSCCRRLRTWRNWNSLRMKTRWSLSLCHPTPTYKYFYTFSTFLLPCPNISIFLKQSIYLVTQCPWVRFWGTKMSQGSCTFPRWCK